MNFSEWADKYYPTEDEEILGKMSLAWAAGVVACFCKEAEKEICACEAYTNVVYRQGRRCCEICGKLENKGEL